MAEDNYEDGQDRMELDFSGMSQGRKGGNRRPGKNSSDPEKRKRWWLFTGAALLIIIVIFAIDFLAGKGSSDKPIALLQARVKVLEEKVDHLAGMEGNIVSIQQQEKALQDSVSGLQGPVKSLQRKLDNVDREVARLNKRMGTTPARTKSTASIRKELISEAHARYHVVRKGESLYKIAKKYGISLQELYRLNNLTSKSVIHPGQRLLVTPNSKK
ncbi:MAG: LysM peptidoglycan-binding domain-containing protein [Desulfatiglandaceae bacterium]|jgi:LysM repeat protein